MKKGFTLIELLAVIVILAIIALIATPIVLNIISDTKESAELRSADFYLDAVEYSIVNATLNNKSITDGTYNVMSDGNICLGMLTNNTCDKDTLEVEVKGEKPNSGTITITNGEISGVNVILNEKEITKNSKGEIVYVKLLDEVCTFKSGTQKTSGAKYECKVDPNKDAYTFYVLNTRNKAGEIITESSTDKTAVSINLIMHQNINSDGTPTTKAISSSTPENGVYNLVPWISNDDYGTVMPYDQDKCWFESGCVLNDKGQITAMNFLVAATKNWTNTNEIIINEFEKWDNTLFKMETYNTHARMPYYNEVGNSNGTNEYLYGNLSFCDPWMGEGVQPTNNISGIDGYWTMTIGSDSGAYTVYCYGVLRDYSPLNGVSQFGIRPVITLKI